MNSIGFDIHGVLTSSPSRFRKMTKIFVESGIDVHFITGARHRDAIKELQYMGFKNNVHYTHFFSILDHHMDNGVQVRYENNNPYIDDDLWNTTKAKYCEENNIDLHIDDTAEYGKYFTTPFCHYGSNTKKERVGILGGAFDPVTKMHISIADYLLSSGHCDTVWLLPCYISLHGKKMTDPELRLRMLNASFEDRDDIVVCAYEIDNQLSGKTYDLMKSMSERFNYFDFKFVIGQDNAEHIYEWYRGDELINEMEFIVIPRKGIQSDVDWYKGARHLFCEDADIEFGSSTIVRDSIKNGTDVSNMVCSDALKIMMKEGLYN